MMKHKKIVTLALATALTASVMMPAFAAPVVIAPAPTAATQEEQAVNYVKMLGTVQSVNEQEQYLIVKNDQMELRFNINADTYLMDGQTGNPVNLSELNGKEVVVSHSEAMTRSIPAQCYAKAVIAKGDVMPNYATIEEVVAGEDGAIRLTTENGGMWVTVAKNADVKPFKTRNIVTLNDLKPGAEVVMYYDMMLMSYPGQAGTDRVILMQEAPVQQETAATEMVSLREAANRLGLELDWSAADRTVIAHSGAFNATVVIGSDDYGIAKMRIKGEKAAEIRNGRTFVPQSFVDALEEALK